LSHAIEEYKHSKEKELKEEIPESEEKS
jgi:hypothetical protein